MTESNNEVELAAYYKCARLPDEKVDAILAASQLARDVRRWRKIALSMVASLIVVTSFGGWLLVRNSHLRRQLASQTSQPIAPAILNKTSAESVDSPVAEQRPTLPAPRYQFVAFRSHDDRCPNCRATGELYAALKTEMTDRPVDFEEFELQKTDQLDKTMQRIDQLDLTSQVAGRTETAFALLLSPTGSKIQQLDPADGLSTIRALTASIIDQ